MVTFSHKFCQLLTSRFTGILFLAKVCKPQDVLGKTLCKPHNKFESQHIRTVPACLLPLRTFSNKMPPKRKTTKATNEPTKEEAVEVIPEGLNIDGIQEATKKENVLNEETQVKGRKPRNVKVTKPQEENNEEIEEKEDLNEEPTTKGRKPRGGKKPAAKDGKVSPVQDEVIEETEEIKINGRKARNVKADKVVEENDAVAEEPVTKGRKPRAVKKPIVPEENDDDAEENHNVKTKGRKPRGAKKETPEEKNPPADEEEIEEKEAPKTKGRKPRAGKNNNAQEEKNPPEEEEEVEEAKGKKTRGGKKPVEKKEAAKEEEVEEKEEPKPRGRKPRAIKKTVSQDEMEKDEEEKVLNEEAKPKGRKRKGAQEDVPKDEKKLSPNKEVIEETEESNEDGSEEGKAKGGRKRKGAKEEKPLEEKKTKKDAAKPENGGENSENETSESYECSKQSSNGDLPNMKISSWNVAGLRSWVGKNGLDYIKNENPDIFCLQETKCNEDDIPEEMKNLEDYPYKHYADSEKKGYAGVALFSKIEPLSVEIGIGENDEVANEGRCITVEFENFYLINVYVPNAGRKLVTLDKRLKWNEIFKEYVINLDKKKPVIVCGDMNVAHNEIDLKNPKTNKKNAGFTQEERDGMTDFLGEDFVDSFRTLYPEEVKYTFWTYMGGARAKDVGWRLDYFIVSKRIFGNVCDNEMRSKVKGSDHCPITLNLHI